MVATVTLDSPETRNALSPELIARVREGLDRALADDGVRVVLLAHEGSVFSAGADLRSGGLHDVGPFIELLRAVWNSAKPVVAHVRGAVRGGGMGLVAACDLVVASERASFACPEVRLGAVPAMVAGVLLQRMSRGDALELFLTGEPFGAERAREAGLVTAVADDPQPWVEALLKGAPGALAVTKRLVNERPGLSELDELGRLSRELLGGEEAAEGIAAFLEKRPARWASA